MSAVNPSERKHRPSRRVMDSTDAFSLCGRERWTSPPSRIGHDPAGSSSGYKNSESSAVISSRNLSYASDVVGLLCCDYRGKYVFELGLDKDVQAKARQTAQTQRYGIDADRVPIRLIILQVDGCFSW